MADLLLELFSEEIPARMQRDAMMELASRLPVGLAKAGLSMDSLRGSVFSTPRRIALMFRDLPLSQAASETELKGPKVGAPDAALQGFLKKSGLTQADLTQRDGTYFAVVKKAGQNTADVLKAAIEDMLLSFPWPKSMRWGSGEQAWVRPLHSILCLFDGKVISVSFAGVTASNTTRGHRFLSPAVITINHVDEYETKLEEAFVIPDRDKRKAIILEQAEKAAATAGLSLKKDEGLLEEVTGLVEWPVVLTGSIDAKFMDLPKEVLVSEMRAHQKYFALEKANDTLSDKFLITANINSTDGGKAIIAGNERVLRARLSDGRFFWDTDRKKPLNEWAEGLKTVTFHAKLGTIADKVERIEILALQLAGYVSGANKTLVQKAARLCKADLVTGMVGEFPELQGVMGRYYAVAQKEDAAVADAIRDHYKPQGPTDTVPSDPVAVCVALADKLDTLVSMFAIGEKPTGSKDPFALRRAALGVIRIILDNTIRLPLKTIFASPPAATIALHMAQDKLAKQTQASLQQPHKVGKYVVINESASEELSHAVPENLSAMLYDFFIDRLKVQLKDQGIRHDVISAVVANGDDDLVRIVNKAKELQELLSSDMGQDVLAAYKRAHNIVTLEEKKDGSKYNAPTEPKLFSIPEEEKLYGVIENLSSAMELAIKIEKFKDVMEMVASMRPSITAFFDKVLVNDANQDIRKNRLNLLSKFCSTLNKVANFALIEGDTKEQKKAA